MSGSGHAAVSLHMGVGVGADTARVKLMCETDGLSNHYGTVTVLLI